MMETLYTSYPDFALVLFLLQDQVLHTKFNVNWEKCEITVVKGKKHHCRTDFAMELIAMVEAGPLTGFQAKVQRQVDRKIK